jgi:hypothetical protein
MVLDKPVTAFSGRIMDFGAMEMFSLECLVALLVLDR